MIQIFFIKMLLEVSSRERNMRSTYRISLQRTRRPVHVIEPLVKTVDPSNKFLSAQCEVQ